MFLPLLSLLCFLAKFIKHKLSAKFAPKKTLSSPVPNGPIDLLGAEYMVDIFAFTSRTQLDKCELVNRRFRAIIERHKNRLPTLKLEEQKKRRAEAFQRWEMKLKWAKANLEMSIFFAIQWIFSIFISSEFTIPYVYFLFVGIYFYYIYSQVFSDGDFYMYFFVFGSGILFSNSISLFLLYTGQFYLYSIRVQIYLTLLIPLIIFQILNFYGLRGQSSPPSCWIRLN